MELEMSEMGGIPLSTPTARSFSGLDSLMSGLADASVAFDESVRVFQAAMDEEPVSVADRPDAVSGADRPAADAGVPVRLKPLPELVAENRAIPGLQPLELPEEMLPKASAPSDEKLESAAEPPRSTLDTVAPTVVGPVAVVGQSDAVSGADRPTEDVGVPVRLKPLPELVAENRAIPGLQPLELPEEMLPEASAPSVERPESAAEPPRLTLDTVAPTVVEVTLPVPVDSTPVVSDIQGVGYVFSPPESSVRSFVQVADALADTLLMRPGLIAGDGEVFVRLKPDVLEGTEIRFVSKGGTVTVEFQPTVERLSTLLVQNQANLVQHLSERVQGVRIAVLVKGRGGEERETA